MTESNASPISRRTRAGLFLFLVAALLVAFVLWRNHAGKAALRPGAFVIALDDASRAGAGWFSERNVRTARAFLAGRTLEIPKGSHVRIAFPDGRVEDVTGPWRQPLGAVEMGDDIADNFLGAPLAKLAEIKAEGSSASAGDVRVTSPVGVTRFTNPTITWVARPETDYDVAIIDPADPMAPVRIAEKVRPPLAFDQLESPQKRRLQVDRLHEVHVRETGSALMIGAARFLVAKDAEENALPAAPADLLREAIEAMGKKPTRTGDAWLALSRLPADWRETELAVRLRLRIAAELGLADEFAQAQESARRLMEE